MDGSRRGGTALAGLRGGFLWKWRFSDENAVVVYD
jgi:hypothetical protein